jgi:hypothetical protein
MSKNNKIADKQNGRSQPNDDEEIRLVDQEERQGKKLEKVGGWYSRGVFVYVLICGLYLGMAQGLSSVSLCYSRLRQ